MGHMSSKDAYRKLGDKIDNLTARTPWSETLHEILKELYRAEEADVVVKMPFGLSSLKKIARITKYDESKLRTILEGLADKGLERGMARIAWMARTLASMTAKA